MRNIKSKLFISFFILVLSANSQDLGIKAGFNTTFTNYVDYTSLPGFQVGVFSNKNLSGNFFIQKQVMIMVKQFEFSDNETEIFSHKSYAVDFPVTIHWDKWKHLSPFAGVAACYNFYNDTDYSFAQADKVEMMPFELSLVGGLSSEFSENISVECCYNFPFLFSEHYITSNGLRISLIYKFRKRNLNQMIDFFNAE